MLQMQSCLLNLNKRKINTTRIFIENTFLSINDTINTEHNDIT